MRLRLLLVLSMVLALGVAVSAASAGEGNPPNPRKLCTKGHWKQWTGLNGGQKFKTEDKCLNYVLSSGASAMFFQTGLDCDAVGGAFGTVNLTNGIGTVIWSCNHWPFTSPNYNVLINDCVDDGGGGFAEIADPTTPGRVVFTCFTP